MSHNQYPIPKRYLQPAALDAFRLAPTQLRAFAKSWEGKSGALLTGPTGCGKTLTAALVAARLIKKESSETWVRWIRADELTRILSERGGVEHIQDLKGSRIVVIDELGYERFPELALELIGSRHDHDRPTIVTSGLKVDAIANRYSDATVRRIVEVGNGCVVDCWGTK